MKTIYRRIAGAFIISRDGYLLLGKNRSGGVYDGQWTIPGGGVKEGEDIVTALVREVREEVSLDISASKIFQLEGVKKGRSIKCRDGIENIVDMHFYDFVVLLDIDKDTTGVMAGDDFENAVWFSPGELEDLDIAPPAQARVKEIITKKLL